MPSRRQMTVYDDDDSGPGASGTRLVVTALVVLALGAIGWFVVGPGAGGDDVAEDHRIASATSTTEAAVTSPPTAAATTGPTAGATNSTAPAASTSAVPTTQPPSTTAASPRTSSAAPPLTIVAPSPYQTLPDGSPAPVIALFGPSTVTVTGAVPTQDAKDRLQALAGQYAKPGQGNVDNQLTVNPAVPANVGVRVAELTSVRFPAGSAEVRPEHGRELDRVAAIMNALPNVTTLVIGHSDQRGDEVTNYALSDQRARAAVNYLVSKGVAPSRLASRAVGETDLLTLNNDAAALELNRRTEFVFYGLLTS